VTGCIYAVYNMLVLAVVFDNVSRRAVNDVSGRLVASPTVLGAPPSCGPLRFRSFKNTSPHKVSE
jgi:hypothetical protein